jgi:hypothetical protein
MPALDTGEVIEVCPVSFARFNSPTGIFASRIGWFIVNSTI